MSARYVLCPGYVVSKRDGDLHYVSAQELARLYGVPINECVVPPEWRTAVESQRQLFWRMHEHLPVLHPRQDGNYTLPSA